MIDVIFLLIVFFVAVSQIVDRDAVPLDLPAFSDTAASEIGVEDKVVVNLIGIEDDQVCQIHVGGHDIPLDDVETLYRVITTRLNGGADEIHIRAERTIAYQYVYEVFESIKMLEGTKHVQLVIKDDAG